jgi:hypothetical protein
MELKTEQMNKRIIISIFTLAIMLPMMAQQDTYPLSGEGDENVVKLFWLPTEWPENLEGFLIKRRKVKGTKAGDWQLVSPTLIIPECSLTKDLSNVEPDAQRQVELQAKLQSYLSGNTSITLKERSREIFINFIQEEPERLSAYSMFYYRDFDIALMHGFALIDRNVPKAKVWEYGLFRVLTDGREELVNDYSWEYGTKPDIEIPMKVSSRARRKNKVVNIEWKFNSADFFENPEIAGFNMYRKVNDGDYTKINDELITVLQGGTQKVILSHRDTDIDSGNVYTFAMAPVSLFNTPGTMVSIEFDLEEVPGDIPEMDFSLVKNEEEKVRETGVKMNWSFDIYNERYINGFKVLRRVNDAVDTIVRIAADQRSFIDNNLPNACRASYRVLADLKGSYPDKISDWKIITLDFIPPLPTGLSAEFKGENGNNFIHVTWDNITPGDTLTRGFKVYDALVSSREETPYLQGSVNAETTSNEYKMVVGNVMYSNTYAFAVTALPYVNEPRVDQWCYSESAFSEIVYVSTPTMEIPGFNIDWETVSNNQVRLTWEFSGDYWDLAGFKVMMNDQQVADHTTLGPDARSFTSAELEKGLYFFTIQAYTSSGVESKVFNKCRFIARTAGN